MCGICGFVGAEDARHDRTAIDAMSAAIAHRGPDGGGAWQLPPDTPADGWLGHRRLRILDLSDAAAQPMLSEDEAIALLFNGEIYGFRDLRRELEGRGRRFTSTGDTEVVLRAYEEWGEDFVERLDGMFAIALWDGRRGRLVLARDRVGKKPLFWLRSGSRLIFASEVKAIAHAPGVVLEPNLGALPAILALGYVPAPATAWKDVHELPPATIASFDPAGGGWQERRYWSALPRERLPELTDEVCAEIRQRLDSAVTSRLSSDVPLGGLLSGGVDSSVVCALMAGHDERQPVTFNVGFPGADSFDERPWARRVAAAIGSDHVELEVRPDATALIDELVWLYDGPFGDSSALSTYLLAEAARTRLTVVLTGDGGDEAFAGYQRFAAAALSRLLPDGAAELLDPLAGLLPGGEDFYRPRRRMRRFLRAAGRPFLDRYLEWVAIFDQAALERLGETGGDGFAATRAEFERAAGLPPVDRLLHANLTTYLPGDLLTKIDRASMAHGLEARAPFLDVRLLELLGRIPARHKVGFRRPKPLLRKVAGDLVPAAVWNRPKHGFGVPLDDWFRGELGDRYADEVLGRDGRAREHLDPAALEALLRDHRGGAPVNGAQLWSVLLVERWLRTASAPDPFRPSRRGSATEVSG